MSIILQGCRKFDETGKDKFLCQNCKYLGDCFSTLSESVAAIAIWLADFSEESQNYKKEKLEKLTKKQKAPTGLYA